VADAMIKARERMLPPLPRRGGGHWCGRWRRRWHGLPAAWACRNVGVIARRLSTIIPVGCLCLRRHCGSRGHLDDHRRRIRIGIGIDPPIRTTLYVIE